MLKLHHHPLSTYSRRVRIALIEKNLTAELIELDMARGAHRAPGYLALNPYGRVPTLEDDGFVLYESTAILEYLEATHPTPALVPGDARGRALVAMHMKLCDIQLARQDGIIIFPKRFLPRERWDEDRKSTRLNSSHTVISYAVFCLKKKKKYNNRIKTRQRQTAR